MVLGFLLIQAILREYAYFFHSGLVLVYLALVLPPTAISFGSAISRIEVQRWRWNYVVDPNDPRFGWVTDIYPFDVAAKALPPR